jgi:hypothetical protein
MTSRRNFLSHSEAHVQISLHNLGHLNLSTVTMMKISENDLCLCLFRRNRDDSFHWAFVIPTNLKEGVVMKFHATQQRPAAAFEYEGIAHPGVLDSVNLRLIVKLSECIMDDLSQDALPSAK